MNGRGCAAIAATLSLGAAATADDLVLQDGGATAGFEQVSPGAFRLADLFFGGVDHLASQSLFLGFPGDGDPQAITDFATGSFAVSDTNSDGFDDRLVVRYGSSEFAAEVEYLFTAGGGIVQLDTSIVITNLTDGPLAGTLWHVADFDLNGQVLDDEASLVNSVVTQRDSDIPGIDIVATTVYSLAPELTQIDNPGPVSIALQTGMPDGTTSAANIDIAWLFGWVFRIGPDAGSTFELSFSTALVPGPGIATIAGLAALTASRRRR